MAEVEGMPKPCVFCAIANGKVPSKKVYEDGDSIAFLDINPRSIGMTIVVPKRHYDDMDDDPVESLKCFQTAETISKMIKKSLGARFVELGILPSDEVPHFHIRLYPVYADEKPIFEGAPLKMNEPELDEVAAKIKSAKVDAFAPANQEGKKSEEKEWAEGDLKYIRNQLDRA